MDDPIDLPKAPEQSAPIRLDEDTELRVLAGVTQLTESVIAEKAVSKAQQKFMGMVHATQKGEKAPSKDVAKVAKEMGKKDAKDFASTKHKGLPEKKTDEAFDADAKTGDTKKTATGTLTKTSTGVKHTRDKFDYDPGSDDKDDKKRKEKARKAAKESIDQEKFKAKFSKMVEAKKDDSVEDKKKKEEKKKKIAKIVDEGSKPDFLDLDKDGNKKEPMKKAAADKGGDKKDGKKGMSAKQEKYFGKKNESAEPSKKVVAESVEQTLSLKDMLRIVKESGGQQQIDPVDQALWNWANRVASAKINESQKAEIFAAMIYERNGGKFEMYDVLAEQQK